jgi:hypothetical protein
LADASKALAKEHKALKKNRKEILDALHVPFVKSRYFQPSQLSSFVFWLRQLQAASFPPHVARCVCVCSHMYARVCARLRACAYVSADRRLF